MGKKRLSRDQQRKAKLAARAKKHPGPTPSMAYSGNTYRKDEYVPIVMHTEIGLIEADAVTGNRLTDRQVREALETIVRSLRADSLPPFDPGSPVRHVPGEETALITLMIRRNWSMLFERYPHPGNEVLAGVLRTMLGSISARTGAGMGPRGFLSYLAGFLKKAGVQIQVRTEDGIVTDTAPDDPLLELGGTWVEYQSVKARQDFLEQAEQRIAAGDGARVTEICHYLAGQAEAGSPISNELAALARTAQASRGSRPPG